jgi:hypothetical protein
MEKQLVKRQERRQVMLQVMGRQRLEQGQWLWQRVVMLRWGQVPPGSWVRRLVMPHRVLAPLGWMGQQQVMLRWVLAPLDWMGQQQVMPHWVLVPLGTERQQQVTLRWVQQVPLGWVMWHCCRIEHTRSSV